MTKYTMRREDVNPRNDEPMPGIWVLRKASDGSFVDCDQYQNDLYERYGRENIFKTLRDWLPYDQIAGSFPHLDKYLDAPVVREFDGRYNRWCLTGHKNVLNWVVIETSENKFKAVGWNENTATGWGFPVAKFVMP